MSIPKISGREARERLRGTTPGPWYANSRVSGDCTVLSNGYGPVAVVSNRVGADPGEVPTRVDGGLLAAAPALAETVAWLYGREADKGRAEKTWHEGDLELGGEWSVQRVSGEVDLTLFNPSTLTPDEAVDLARALLAAAEEARRG